MTDNGQTEKPTLDDAIASAEKASDTLDKITENIGAIQPKKEPESPATPPTNFPPLLRRFFDVFHDDERHELWVGIKMRTNIKGQTRNGGPIEDVEVNLDAISIVTALDAAKQEALVVLMRDQQNLNEQRARRAALKDTGVLGRLNLGLSKAVGSAKKILIH